MPGSRAVGSSDWVTTGDLEEDTEDEGDLDDQPNSEFPNAAAAAPAHPDQTDSPKGALTQVADLFASGKRELRLEDIASVLPFALDKFQAQSLEILLRGSSVVVSAPTGAGKTVIAEAATIAVLARGQRVIYTTPLKALSNQKLYEMRQRFGSDMVGLQTGDASLNLDSSIVVMTTEVLRNIMYRTDATTTGESQAVERLNDVGLVVLDEVHYLGDPSRGSVWEEVIINCPAHIQLCAMSATVANADDLGAWIDEVHGSCETVVTKYRPVPLEWYFGFTAAGSTHLLPLFSGKGRTLNPALRRPEPEKYMGVDWGRWDHFKSGKYRDGKDNDNDNGKVTLPYDEPKWKRMAPLEDVVMSLANKAMLPAIYFIFSRAACDNAALLLDEQGVSLTTPDEQMLILYELESLRADQPEAVKENLVPALVKGFASHHAGLLPGWKGIVENLFQQGVLKVVFATETLAAGINMPARTTIISTLSRRRDQGIQMLTHNELLQMAGRAGRRGFDTTGNCVVLQSRFEEPEDVHGIIMRGPEALQSQFSTGYGMVLNLLHSRSLAEAREFIQRSFSNYLGGTGYKRRMQEIQQMEERAASLAAQAAQAEGLEGTVDEVVARYDKATARLREERRALKLLIEQAVESRAAAARDHLSFLGMPRTVGLDLAADDIDVAQPLPALAVAEVDFLAAPGLDPRADPSDTRYLCLTADNRLVQVRAHQIAAVMEGDLAGEGGRAAAAIVGAADSVRAWTAGKGGAFYAQGTGATAVLAARIPQAQYIAPLELEPEVEDGVGMCRERVAAARADADRAKSNVGLRQAVRQDMRLRAKATILQRRAKEMRAALEGQLSSTWQRFQDVTAVLVAAGALAPNTLKAQPLGEVAREVMGENELWLGMALTHAALQDLAAPQLAGALAALVAGESVSRPSISAAYEPSQAVCNAIEALEDERERLYELQVQADIAAPLSVDLRLSGVVEAWASGSTWEQTMTDCNLDDGDVARLLNRTTDLLKQAGHCTALLPALRREARKAVHAMNRKPISDLIA
ncbi:probable helicase HelY [Coccomyxa sp. Obi]|nr:probable helicase HelY [Coccomyxa sp. Obi]